MNNLNEQMVIEKLLNNMLPSKEVNYEGMLGILTKSFPTIRFDNLSCRNKRIMYLQLLGHSISQNLNKIIKQTNDLYHITKLTKFKTEIEMYFKSLLTLKFKNDSEFQENQRKMSLYFATEWSYLNSIVSCITKQCVFQ